MKSIQTYHRDVLNPMQMYKPDSHALRTIDRMTGVIQRTRCSQHPRHHRLRQVNLWRARVRFRSMSFWGSGAEIDVEKTT